ncbi:MAG: hypothetical protein AB7G37_03410 [Solirubrobacteraceae bacterium]
MSGTEIGAVLGGLATLVAAFLGGGGIAKVLREVRAIGHQVNNREPNQPTVHERLDGIEALIAEHTDQDRMNFEALARRIDSTAPVPGGRRATDPPEGP